MNRILPVSLSVVILAASTAHADPAAKAPTAKEKIEVTVIAILASEKHNEINKKLIGFAHHVRKKEPKLTGFRIERTTSLPLELGQTEKFKLPGNEVVEVTVNKERNEEGRITLTIKPPMLDQITYACACSKFFSMATQHFVKKGNDRQQLFIAVKASPCMSKKKDK